MTDHITVRIPAEAAGMRLSDYLTEHGHSLNAPCGGRGTCGKCRVQVISGSFLAYGHPEEAYLPDGEGYLLACRAVCTDTGAEIHLPITDGTGLTAYQNNNASAVGEGVGYGIALDIGTTTLAAALVDRQCGTILSTASRHNPQKSYGADVISRINACREGHLADLQGCLLSAVKDMIAQLAAACPGVSPDLMTVAGNTTMLHIFAGVSPESMGSYPFTPRFIESKTLNGAELGLPIPTVILLPSISAFVGSDVVGGLYTAALRAQAAPTLLIDVGTNGEMILSTGSDRGGRLLSASTAAGPALEGANISCGMGGVAGAVSRVSGDAVTPIFRTVEDAPAVGLCGCGLIDLVAYLLESGELDETGYLDDDPYRLSGMHERAGDRIPAQTPVQLTGKDVREFQLAKSAIRAGIEALLDAAELSVSDLGHIYLAGGMGYYLDPRSAIRVGLLPEISPRKVEAIGNSALAGAVACLIESDAISKMITLAVACESYELATSAVFMEQFIEQMMFPEE